MCHLQKLLFRAPKRLHIDSRFWSSPTANWFGSKVVAVTWFRYTIENLVQLRTKKHIWSHDDGSVPDNGSCHESSCRHAHGSQYLQYAVIFWTFIVGIARDLQLLTHIECLRANLSFLYWFYDKGVLYRNVRQLRTTCVVALPVALGGSTSVPFQ